MLRPTPHEIDAAILDAAASLFARHGVSGTSLQAVADAVGYSKAGLLHHFATKAGLARAAVAACRSAAHDVAEGVSHLAEGPARDHAALTALADLARRRPGFVALMVATAGPLRGTAEAEELAPVAADLFRAFSAPPPTPGVVPHDPRIVRIVGALGALALTSLALGGQVEASARRCLVATSYDALGHGHPPDRSPDQHPTRDPDPPSTSADTPDKDA